MNKPDRRIERTRRLLHTALVEMIQEKSFAEVSIQEICDRADVGRTTFYFHYRDKEELLTSSLQALMGDIAAKLPPISWEAIREGRMLPGLNAFMHVQENEKFYRAMLGPNGPAFIASRVRAFMAEAFAERLTYIAQISPTPPDPAIDVLSYHLAGSLLALVGWWLNEDLAHSPEEMAAIFIKLNQPSVEKALNLGAITAQRGASS